MYPYYMDMKNLLKYVSTLFVKGFNWPIKLKGFLFVYLTKVIHNFGKVTPPNAGFSDKIESVNYNAAPAIARIMKSCFLDKMYKESGLEHLQQRKWIVPLCSRKSFQTGNHHTFTTYFHKKEILTDTPTLAMYFHVELNTSKILLLYVINPFSRNVPFLYPLKIENLRFYDVFRRYRSGTFVEYGLMNGIISTQICNIVVIIYTHLELKCW